MDSAYWNRVALNYDKEIFDVSVQDRAGLIPQRLDLYGNQKSTALDIGCGTGNFIPALAARFRQVHALDISQRCIARATARHAALPNVTFRQIDISAKNTNLPAADLALCVNTLLTPSLTHRIQMLQAISKALQTKGHLILVVPALESALLTNARLIEWNLRSRVKPALANRSGFGGELQHENRRLYEGIVELDGVPTKHYTREELEILLSNHKLQIKELVKIEYPWTTEFPDAPKWMQNPYPWDWLCVARKTGRS